MSNHHTLLDRLLDGHALVERDALALADCDDLDALTEVAAALRDRGQIGRAHV